MSTKNVPTKLESFQVAAKAAADTEVDKSTEYLQQLLATSEQYFPSNVTVSSVQQQYGALAIDSTKNDTLEQTLAVTVDSANAVATIISKYQQYIALTIPKIEDGGNFGVGIQLEALKAQTDVLDKISKGVEELLKYSSSRADAIEKLKLPGVVQTSSQTTSSGDAATTGGEKGDTTTTNQSKAQETKVIETTATPASIERSTRTAAVVVVDVTFYLKAKSLFQQIVFGYISITDYMDKNKDKIAKPKGDSGRSGGYGNMY